MPYCPKCGNFYYSGTLSCSTCGQLLNSVGKPKVTGGEFSTVRKQTREKRCPYCNSLGNVNGPVGRDAIAICPVCKGRRYNLIPEDWHGCKRCNGTGEYAYSIIRKPCLECKGTGWVGS